MRTKHFWQPALRKLFSLPTPDDRRAALQFLLETMKKFQVTYKFSYSFSCRIAFNQNLNKFCLLFLQTEEKSEIQLVDLSFVISNPPQCLISSSSILASFLRGAGITLVPAQDADDGDKYEEQIVFQPENCQENLRILEALFTVLVKGKFLKGSFFYNIVA